MSFLRKTGKLFVLAGVLPLQDDANDVVSKHTKTYKSYVQRPPSKETGWERLKEMFQLE